MLAVPSGMSPAAMAMPRDTHNVLWAPLPVDQRVLPIRPQVISPVPAIAPSTAPRLSFALQSGGATCVGNEIAQENCLPGAPRSEWDLAFTDVAAAAGDPSIQGFTTEFSINRTATSGPARVRFKVDTTAAKYRLQIYRMGYYGGMGARRIATVTQPTGPGTVTSDLTGTNQPACLTEDTGLIDCGNWSVSATWDIPANAVSGIYFAKAIRQDNGGSSHIFFVIRDDEGGSDLLFQTSDTTWQAYNDYGGNSLYTGSPAGRAYKVSYNRPFTTRAASAGAHLTWVFSAEYPMVRWLEANGYDVSYTSGIDTDRAGAELQEHKVFLSVGHDEYWSGQQRANVEAARDAGRHLAFFSGNEVFWKTRWEPSIDASATPYRTLVSYKETHGTEKIDPEVNIWTGTWRDPRAFNPEGPLPENALTGTIFTVNGERDDAIMVPGQFGRHRFWRNTGIASLQTGQTAILPQGTLGYEWDEDLDNGFRPAGLQRLSSTTIDVTPKYLLDHGSNYGVGTATHNLTLYRATSGALVFGAGTVQWSWGLDTNHDSPNNAEPSPEMRQATVNLFADMGVQPSSPQSGIQTSTGTSDLSPPTSTIVSPPPNSSVQSGDSLVISGTASDTNGVLASVEVSVDGGQTWLAATGLETWQFPWVATGNVPVTLMSRAVDDSGNVQTVPASRVVNVARTCPCGIWPDSAVPAVSSHPDSTPVELGVRFQAEVGGVITGIRFYKGVDNLGTHVGTLWTSNGQRLASATFQDESDEGWQQVQFATPVAIDAGVTYVASYFAPEWPLCARLGIRHGGAAAGARGRHEQRAAARAGRRRGRHRQWRVPREYAGVPDGVAPVEQLLGGRPVRAQLQFHALRQRPHPGARRDGRDPVHDRDRAFERGSRHRHHQRRHLSAARTRRVRARRRVRTSRRRARSCSSRRFASRTPPSTSATVQGGPGGLRSSAGLSLLDDVTWTFKTSTPVVCPCTIWTPETVPTFLINNADDQEAVKQGIELGVRFRADTDGYISGIRFYKSANNIGTHTGTLWSNNGTALAHGTFTSETSSGWQQLTFPAPVPILANQTYVASYHTTVGRYSVNRTYFMPQFTPSFTRAPLRALVDGQDGPNGVFKYGAHSFPTGTFLQSNYWVDVVFMPADAGATTPPLVVSHTPAAGAIGVDRLTNVTAHFSESLNPSTVTASTVELRNTQTGALVPAALSYDDATRNVTVNPSGTLSAGTAFTVTMRGGPTGLRDLFGDPMVGNVTWSFTTQAPIVCPCTIWPSTTKPGGIVDNSGDVEAVRDGVELGVRFRADLGGYINGIRFYKGPNNTGAHTGTLWDNNGNQLATAEFTNESETGWQEVRFATPVQIDPNVTYIASYHAPAGGYSVDAGYFVPGNGPAFARPPLRALASGVDGANGVFRYGPSGFPTGTFNAGNYWVDVVYTTLDAALSAAPTVVATTPADGGEGVPTDANLTAQFSEAIQASTLTTSTFQLRVASTGVLVPASVSYNAVTRVATLNPTAPLAASTPYIALVKGGGAGVKDLGGEALEHDVSWIFTTKTPIACPCSIWTPGITPATVDNTQDINAAELGVKFRADRDGSIRGIRFYRSAANVGPHTVTLWDANGTPLASAPFTSTAATPVGWQQVLFPSPVAITANHTYIASYHAPVGRYSVNFDYFLSQNAAWFTRPPLRALTSDEDGPNGVYKYGPAQSFPTQTHRQSNYWVDVVFDLSSNQAPVAVDDTYNTPEDTLLSVPPLGVLANDTDDGQSLAAVLAAAPAAGTLVLQADGSFTYMPAANAAGPVTFSYQARDGAGLVSNVATVTVTVDAVNDPPSISDITNKSTQEDVASGPHSFTVGDVETAAASLTVTATSSNTALVPNANITFGGSGARADGDGDAGGESERHGDDHPDGERRDQHRERHVRADRERGERSADDLGRREPGDERGRRQRPA